MLAAHAVQSPTTPGKRNINQSPVGETKKLVARGGHAAQRKQLLLDQFRRDGTPAGRGQQPAIWRGMIFRDRWESRTCSANERPRHRSLPEECEVPPAFERGRQLRLETRIALAKR